MFEISVKIGKQINLAKHEQLSFRTRSNMFDGFSSNPEIICWKIHENCIRTLCRFHKYYFYFLANKTQKADDDEFKTVKIWMAAQPAQGNCSIFRHFINFFQTMIESKRLRTVS